MVNWQAVQDGNVITRRMTDFDVWIQCEIFGAPVLIEALKFWLEENNRGTDENQTMDTPADSEPTS